MAAEVGSVASSGRRHWAVDNRLHWRFGPQFTKALPTTQAGFAANVLAAVRRITTRQTGLDKARKWQQDQLQVGRQNGDFPD